MKYVTARPKSKSKDDTPSITDYFQHAYRNMPYKNIMSETHDIH